MDLTIIMGFNKRGSIKTKIYYTKENMVLAKDKSWKGKNKTDYMIVYIDNSKLIFKVLELMSEVSKVTGYKTSLQKSISTYQR